MTPDQLPVALHGTHLGELVRSGDRALLRWSDEARERWSLNATVLSRTLRVGFSNVAQTESFFGGLLPEGIHLDRLASHAQVASNDLVGLLAVVGADLAGALRVGSERDNLDPEVLDPAQIVALMERADGFLVGGGGSALPGFQRKLTLTRDNGRWIKGNGTMPSTHILKPVPIENRRVIEAEAYTLRLARQLNLASYEVSVEEIGDRAVLVVERYDRRRSDSGTIERLHQEDTAQALGLPWGGNDKFQNTNPGANFRAIAGLLDSLTTVFDPEAAADRLRLLQYAVFTVAVGNSDAHAKNFSLLRDTAGADRLAPLYDAAPLALDFAGSQGLALYINGISMLPDVTAEDLVAEALSWGLNEGAARTTVARTLDELIQATRTTDAHPSIERHVPGYIRRQAQNLAAGRPARIPSPVPLMAHPRLGSESTGV